MAVLSQLADVLVQPQTSARAFAKSASSPFYFPGKMQADNRNRYTATAMSGSVTRKSCTKISSPQRPGTGGTSQSRERLRHCAVVVNPAGT